MVGSKNIHISPWLAAMLPMLCTTALFHFFEAAGKQKRYGSNLNQTTISKLNQIKLVIISETLLYYYSYERLKNI